MFSMFDKFPPGFKALKKLDMGDLEVITTVSFTEPSDNSDESTSDEIIPMPASSNINNNEFPGLPVKSPSIRNSMPFQVSTGDVVNSKSQPRDRTVSETCTRHGFAKLMILKHLDFLWF
jgi:hypothetical protein